MTLLGKLKAIERRHPFGIYGLLLGVLATAWFGVQRNASLAYRVFSETPIIDAKQDIPKLAITFDGKSVSGQLRIITLRIESDGNKAITEADYSKDSPLGFKITGGTMLDRPTVIDASDDGLRRVGTSLVNEKVAQIDSVLLNPGDYIILKILVVAEQNDNTIKILPTGRIAGVAHIPVSLEYSRSIPSVLWKWGKWLLYLFLGLFVLDSIFLVTSGRWRFFLYLLADILRGRAYYKGMKKDIEKFLKLRGKRLQGVYKWLLQESGRHGEGYLVSIRALLSDEEMLLAAIHRIKNGEMTIEQTIEEAKGDDIFKITGLRGIMRGIKKRLTLTEMKQVVEDFLDYYETVLYPSPWAISEKPTTPDDG